MAVRDPDAVTRRVIDAVLAVLLIVSVGAYWKAYVAPGAAPAVRIASLGLAATPVPASRKIVG